MNAPIRTRNSPINPVVPGKPKAPKAKITNIRIAPNPETNSYLCEIDFLVKGFTTPQKVRTSLDRTA